LKQDLHYLPGSTLLRALIIIAGGEINSGDGLRIDALATHSYTLKQWSLALEDVKWQ